MKNTKKCPKCGSHNIRVFKFSLKNPQGQTIFTGTLGFTRIKLDRYVCGSCGYVEAWVSEDDLPKVMKHGESVR